MAAFPLSALASAHCLPSSTMPSPSRALESTSVAALCWLSSRRTRKANERSRLVWRHEFTWRGNRCACAPEEVPNDDADLPGSLSPENEVDKALQGEESQALLRDLAAAAGRVAAARHELETHERRQKNANELRAQIKRMEAVDTVVAECQGDVSAAEAELNAAGLALVKSYHDNSLWDPTRKWETTDIDENRERLESLKAATASALVGTIANLPFSLSVLESTETEILFNEALIFFSCALFGVTYRYVVRRDLGNTQLKAGSAAAFAVVRGLGQLDAARVFSSFPDGASQQLFEASVFAVENLIIFGFAALVLDYGLRESFLNPFPTKKSESSD